jgi:hypothetical protein
MAHNPSRSRFCGGLRLGGFVRGPRERQTGTMADVRIVMGTGAIAVEIAGLTLIRGDLRDIRQGTAPVDYHNVQHQAEPTRLACRSQPECST